MSLKLKLAALLGLCLTMVINAACMGGKDSGKGGKPDDERICPAIARVCRDGSPATYQPFNENWGQADPERCKQVCPEDGTNSTTSTSTSTNTNTSSSTSTNTSAS